MKIISIRIQNYRAIEDVTVNLNYKINPIIGINESGKTSILKAILALDKSRDRFNKGEHLEYQNKYITKNTVGCRVTAKLKFSENDLNELRKFCQFKDGSEEYDFILTINNDTVLPFTRKLSESREFGVINDEVNKRVESKLVKFIQSKFPVFLYFDDFTDRVPERIQFSETYTADGKLGRGVQREWQEIVEEILRRSELEGIDEKDKTLQSYLKTPNRDRRNDMLSDVEDVLNTEIIEEWKKIKQRGKNNFADDSENLMLELDNDEFSFQFKVRDTSHNNKKRTFNVSERSKGFQWFFNYMIKLKFNPRYRDTQENSIFLLDEPGSYLHSSAQVELLKELKAVSKKNTIIYCTHSQFLLNPEDIKLGSIKIAEKVQSKVKLHLFGSYKNKKTSGALSPIFQALQLNYSHNFVGKIIITEGILDYYILKMTQQYWNEPKEDINIIPGHGAGGSTNLISFALGFSDDFKIVFDNDPAGHRASEKYEKEFGDSIKRSFCFYHLNENKFKLENHFSKNDQVKLLEMTGASKIKRAIPILYFDLTNEIQSFLEGLSDETISYLKKTVDSLRFNE